MTCCITDSVTSGKEITINQRLKAGEPGKSMVQFSLNLKT